MHICLNACFVNTFNLEVIQVTSVTFCQSVRGLISIILMLSITQANTICTTTVNFSLFNSSNLIVLAVTCRGIHLITLWCTTSSRSSCKWLFMWLLHNTFVFTALPYDQDHGSLWQNVTFLSVKTKFTFNCLIKATWLFKYRQSPYKMDNNAVKVWI
jgi:hypothetical protein